MEQYSLVYDDGYNTVGNLTDVTEYSTDTMEYEYDALYRLTSETRTGTGSYSHDYEYDLAGNLTTLDSSAFATYDDANKFSSLSIGTYEYDSDGNMRRFAGSGLPTTYNTWDVRGKIISSVISGDTIAWEYDHRGLRVSRRGGIPNRYYIFAGSTLIGEIHGTTPAYAYTWGPDGIVSQRDIANTESYWYQFGPQGETRALVDDSASTVETYAFDAYGITLSGAPTLYNPFKYGGKFGYYSEDTAFGRILAGQRWYSPEHRRWISRDPIEYAGGDSLYAYVMGDPVNLVDVEGTQPTVVAIGAEAAKQVAGKHPAVVVGATVGYACTQFETCGIPIEKANSNGVPVVVQAIADGVENISRASQAVVSWMCGADDEDAAKHDENQEALKGIAKEYEKRSRAKPIDPEDAETLQSWAEEYGMPGRSTDRPERHKQRKVGQRKHIHVGGKKKIFVK